MNRHAIGVQIGATTSPAELRAVVAEADQLGYGEIWLAEDYFDLGGIASAATALAATDEIPIGLGVVAAAARHPAATAMEFATLGGVYPGRFMAGIGSRGSWMGTSDGPRARFSAWVAARSHQRSTRPPRWC